MLRVAAPVVLVLAFIFYGSTSFVYAESVVWSDIHPKLYSGGPFYVPDHSAFMKYRSSSWWRMDDVYTSVRYNVRVVNLDTGEVLGRNTTVPQGTKLSFEFIPFVPQDISWNGVGSYNDTPYGDWIPPETQPPSHQCRSSNLIAQIRGDKSLELYAQFLVQTPQKRIVGLGGFSCTSSALGQECIASQAGTFSTMFEFDETSGYFYASRIEYNANEAAERLTGAPPASTIPK